MKVSIFADYSNQWVAVKQDLSKVYYSGKTFSEVYNEIEKRYKKVDLMLMYVPPIDQFIAPHEYS